jgi:hypothetical protein
MGKLIHTSESYLETAEALIRHLRGQLKNTTRQKEWTDGNLDALRSFDFKGYKVTNYPTPARDVPADRKMEFLWDFIAYASGFGILLAAESEWKDLSSDPTGLRHDFEKLLYVKSPLKLMMCRRNNKNSGVSIAKDLSKYAHGVCSNYSSGEVFILYCVGWLEDDARNDEVFLFQIAGPVTPCSLTEFNFRLWP